MLREVRWLHGALIHAQDGEIGRVDEILFDDEHLVVRYLIVDTGNWLAGRKVLISPQALGHLDWEAHTLHVKLTRKQVEKSPGIETDQPVSRQWEMDYYNYYAWPYYWDGMGGWGNNMFMRTPSFTPVESTMTPQQQDDLRAQNHADAHLRSTKEVTGYEISAIDGHLGHVQDFIVDDVTWQIRYLCIDTHDWWPEKKVMIPANWITEMNWPERDVLVNVTRAQIQASPEWDHTRPIDDAFIDQLNGHYSQQQPDLHGSEHTSRTAVARTESELAGVNRETEYRSAPGPASAKL